MRLLWPGPSVPSGPPVGGLTFLGCSGGALLRGGGLLLGWSRCCSADRHHTRLTCTESRTKRVKSEEEARPGTGAQSKAASFIATTYLQKAFHQTSPPPPRRTRCDPRTRKHFPGAFPATPTARGGKNGISISPFCQCAFTMMASHKADKIQFAFSEKQRSAPSCNISSAQKCSARRAATLE